MLQWAQTVLSGLQQSPEVVELQVIEILYPGTKLEVTHSTAWVVLTEHCFRFICGGIHANGKMVKFPFKRAVAHIPFFKFRGSSFIIAV